jgi:hypothetical protein
MATSLRPVADLGSVDQAISALKPYSRAMVANGLGRLDFQGESRRLDIGGIAPQSLAAPERPEFKLQQLTKFSVLFVHKTK